MSDNDKLEPSSEEQESLRAFARGLLPEADGPRASYEDVQARVARARRSIRLQAGLGVLGAALAGAVLVAARGRGFDPFATGVAAGIAAGAAIVLVQAWRATRAVASPGSDPIDDLRCYYLRRLRAVRTLVFVVPLLMLAFSMRAPLSNGLRVALVAGTVLLALNGRFRVLPKLARELKTLEGR